MELTPTQLTAYFAFTEVSSLLRHAVERQLRDVGDLSYVQFQLLARLGELSHAQPFEGPGEVGQRRGVGGGLNRRPKRQGQDQRGDQPHHMPAPTTPPAGAALATGAIATAGGAASVTTVTARRFWA